MRYFGKALLLWLSFSLVALAQAKEFEVGNVGFKDYDGYYYFLDLENLTATNLGVGANFTDITISFSLDDGSGSYENNYIITLSDPNKDNVYDDLTYLWLSNYVASTNTYYDGEGIASLAPGESVLDLLFNPYNSALLIDPNLYIKNLSVSFDFTLNNFSYIDNGIPYVFSGTISYQKDFLTDQWYQIADLSFWSEALTVDIQGAPVGGTQPIPEPSSLMLVSLSFASLFVVKNRLGRK